MGVAKLMAALWFGGFVMLIGIVLGQKEIVKLMSDLGSDQYRASIIFTLGTVVALMIMMVSMSLKHQRPATTIIKDGLRCPRCKSRNVPELFMCRQCSEKYCETCVSFDEDGMHCCSYCGSELKVAPVLP